MKTKRAVVEKMLLITRSKDELSLLLREMKDNVKYYRSCVLPKLASRKEEILEKINDMMGRFSDYFVNYSNNYVKL